MQSPPASSSKLEVRLNPDNSQTFDTETQKTRAEESRRCIMQPRLLTRGAVDGVNMRRNGTRIRNRVHSSESNTTRTFHTPEGMGAAEQRRGGGKQSEHGGNKDVSNCESSERHGASDGQRSGGKEWTTQPGGLID